MSVLDQNSNIPFVKTVYSKIFEVLFYDGVINIKDLVKQEI